MKKIFLSVVMLIVLTATLNAQDFSENAIGLRLGDNDGFGGEVSYQRRLANSNRLELDLGWRNSNKINAFKLTGIYQWVWNIDGGFNWYAGVGGGIGSWSDNNSDVKDSRTFVFAAGDIGIEYNFDEAPIQLCLDFRPEYVGNGYYEKNYDSDIALGIRYKF
jgi:opacity protein-like surface antigen